MTRSLHADRYALRSAGWGVVADSRVRREETCPEGAGRRGKVEIADYVLTIPKRNSTAASKYRSGSVIG